MDKIIIRLIVPTISREFDMYIPVSITISELTNLMIKAVEDITNKRYVSSGNEILCLKEKNTMLIQEAMVQSYGIQNGDHIVMI